LQALLSLAQEAATLNCGHQTRFAINASGPPDRCLKITQEVIAAHAAPHVIKIDGGLDGLSACQLVRTQIGQDPIITCYPLLGNQMRGRVPQRVFVKFLIWSGADIIYPSELPQLGSAAQINATSIAEGVAWYDEITASYAAMPTIAGGIYPGQLHAYYELLGEDVAFFLGGAVALHPDGPIRGAELCKKIIDEAVRKKIYGDSTKLSDALILEIESSFGTQYPYIAPQQLKESFKAKLRSDQN
jgi:ribulose 1,5-bisphosphate carboxylase large subunit-like protein